MSDRDDRPLHPNLADALGDDIEPAPELDAIARRLADLDRGVEAAVLAHQVDAGDFQRPDLLRVGRLHVPREIQKLAIEIRRDSAR